MLGYVQEFGSTESVRSPGSFKELIDEYGGYALKVRDLAEGTVKSQQLYLARFLAAQQEETPTALFVSLTRVRVQRFVFEYPETYGPRSRSCMQSALRGFLRFCHQRGYIPSDLSCVVPTFRSRRLSSVPRAIEDDTIRLLLDSIDDASPVGLRDRAIILLLVTYGVRGVQIRELRFDDVEWAGDRIRFRAVKRGKAVLQHLTPEVGNSLLAYIREARPTSTSYAEVFLTSRRPFRPFRKSGSLSSMIARRLCRIDAQLSEGVSRGAHGFRHAFASRLAGKVPLKYIADMLGHRDLSSSYIYAKVDFEALCQTAQPWPVEEER